MRDAFILQEEDKPHTNAAVVALELLPIRLAPPPIYYLHLLFVLLGGSIQPLFQPSNAFQKKRMMPFNGFLNNIYATTQRIDT